MESSWSAHAVEALWKISRTEVSMIGGKRYEKGEIYGVLASVVYSMMSVFVKIICMPSMWCRICV